MATGSGQKAASGPHDLVWVPPLQKGPTPQCFRIGLGPCPEASQSSVGMWLCQLVPQAGKLLILRKPWLPLQQNGPHNSVDCGEV